MTISYGGGDGGASCCGTCLFHLPVLRSNWTMDFRFAREVRLSDVTRLREYKTLIRLFGY